MEEFRSSLATSSSLSAAKHNGNHTDKHVAQDEHDTNTSSSAVDNLCNSIRESLDRKGVLCQIRSLLRSEIFTCLEDSTAHLAISANEDVEDDEQRRAGGTKSYGKCNGVTKQQNNSFSSSSSLFQTPPTSPPIENTIINEMIREYLLFNGYNNTSRVFSTELSGETKHGGGFAFHNDDEDNNGGLFKERRGKKENETLLPSHGREIIMQDLGIVDHGNCHNDMIAPWVVSNNNKRMVKSNLPLLYGIVEALKRQKVEREQAQI